MNELRASVHGTTYKALPSTVGEGFCILLDSAIAFGVQRNHGLDDLRVAGVAFTTGPG